MRQKKPCIVLSFATTTQAMAVEDYCKQHSLPGRLIPVPTQITAGCGFAWKADITDKESLLAALTEGGITWDAATELLL